MHIATRREYLSELLSTRTSNQLEDINFVILDILGLCDTDEAATAINAKRNDVIHSLACCPDSHSSVTFAFKIIHQ